jgi:hypothetical protein
MRKSGLFMLMMAGGVVALAALTWQGAAGRHGRPASSIAARRAAKALEITDPCLFTEARYTRHLSLADRHTPFQEHPLSLEHFPSGSLTLPPPSLKTGLDPRSPGGAPATP